ncbi:c-type cytochrome [Chitiniphilus purpureus]|uniref:C-type cytochrome n=1 Tax=Chitiniphilus purpureus TaxID=2981137 RepID=A0ABY6DMQ4_9NEIS|nr:c-type cytochrome [Chitiniphilus sp. CD1]UXY14978.1 c-type cytochrome [Chitiniphilus sp. CD1]
MRRYTSLAALAVVFNVSSVGAKAEDVGAKLAREKNCLACHAMDKKLVGPSYKDVAKKYAGQKDSVNLLVTKVMKGGSGVWGAVPMPPQAVSDAEAHTLVKWILKQQ